LLTEMQQQVRTQDYVYLFCWKFWNHFCCT
jgi:hypothetical protein